MAVGRSRRPQKRGPLDDPLARRAGRTIRYTLSGKAICEAVLSASDRGEDCQETATETFIWGNGDPTVLCASHYDEFSRKAFWQQPEKPVVYA